MSFLASLPSWRFVLARRWGSFSAPAAGSPRRRSFAVTAKNVWDEPDAFYREDNPAKLYRFNTTGAYWTVGMKGTF